MEIFIVLLNKDELWVANRQPRHGRPRFVYDLYLENPHNIIYVYFIQIMNIFTVTITSNNSYSTNHSPSNPFLPTPPPHQTTHAPPQTLGNTHPTHSTHPTHPTHPTHSAHLQTLQAKTTIQQW